MDVIFPPQRAARKEESQRGWIEKQNPAIKLAFMEVSPPTTDKTNRN